MANGKTSVQQHDPKVNCRQQNSYQCRRLKRLLNVRNLTPGKKDPAAARILLNNTKFDYGDESSFPSSSPCPSCPTFSACFTSLLALDLQDVDEIVS